MADLKALRNDIEKMVRELCGVVGILPERATETEREAIGAFAFGMVASHCVPKGLTLSQMNALADIMLMDVLRYTPESAIAFSHNLVMSLDIMAGSNHHPGLHAIIHRGFEGYKQWEAGDVEWLRKNLQGVFDWLANGADTYTEAYRPSSNIN